MASRAHPDPLKQIKAARVADRFGPLVCAAGQILPLRHSQQGLEYDPRLGGVQLAFCGWIPFRQLWLLEPAGETVNA